MSELNARWNRMKDNEINCLDYTCGEFSDAATRAIERMVVHGDRHDSVPLEHYLKSIQVITDNVPTAEFHLVSVPPMPKRVIYSGRATIVIWDDGTKTVVKCSRHDDWSPDAGFLWALGERVYGSKAQLVKAMREHAFYEYKK